MSAMNEKLTYEDVLEYPSDREGDSVEVGSLPTLNPRGEHKPTMLGLKISCVLGQ